LIREKDRRYDPAQLRRTLIGIFGEEYETQRNQFRVTCFKCGDATGHLEINLLSGFFHCWKCGYSGRRLANLFKDYLGYVPKIEEYVSEDELRKPRLFERTTEDEEIVPFKGLPDDFVLFTGVENFQGQMALRWLKKRMPMENILKYGIGYCLKGKYKDRIVVPCREDGKVVYFSARSIADRVKPKYLNPEAGEYGGEGKGSVVFNLDGALRTGTAILCEGVFDAMHIGESGVCIFGTDPSETQIHKLSHGVKKVVVMLDYDARVKSFQVADKFSLMNKSLNIYRTGGFDVRCIVLPKGGDPDEYPRETIFKLIEESKPLSLDQYVATLTGRSPRS